MVSILLGEECNNVIPDSTKLEVRSVFFVIKLLLMADGVDVPVQINQPQSTSILTTPQWWSVDHGKSQYKCNCVQVGSF